MQNALYTPKVYTTLYAIPTIKSGVAGILSTSKADSLIANELCGLLEFFSSLQISIIFTPFTE